MTSQDLSFNPFLVATDRLVCDPMSSVVFDRYEIVRKLITQYICIVQNGLAFDYSSNECRKMTAITASQYSIRSTLPMVLHLDTMISDQRAGKRGDNPEQNKNMQMRSHLFATYLFLNSQV